MKSIFFFQCSQKIKTKQTTDKLRSDFSIPRTSRWYLHYSPISVFLYHDLQCVRHSFLFLGQMFVRIDAKGLVDKLYRKLRIGHLGPIVLNPGEFPFRASVLIAVVDILFRKGNSNIGNETQSTKTPLGLSEIL